MMSGAMIPGSCHCGKVSFSVAHEPNWLTACNCTICRRIGALWAHFERKDVLIDGADKTLTYIQGDKTLAVHGRSHLIHLQGRKDAALPPPDLARTEVDHDPVPGARDPLRLGRIGLL